MGSKKSKSKKSEPIQDEIIETPDFIPDKICISMLGGILYKDEMCRIIDIFIRNKTHIKVGYQYMVEINNIKLYIDVENERSYESRDSCNRYSPYKGFNSFIIVGDLSNSKFIDNIMRYIKNIEYYTNREKYMMIVGFDSPLNVNTIQNLLLKARHVNDNIFFTLPKELVYIIVWLIGQNISWVPLRDTENILIDNRIIAISENRDIPFMPVSLRSGYNIDNIFMSLIKDTIKLLKD